MIKLNSITHIIYVINTLISYITCILKFLDNNDDTNTCFVLVGQND